MAQHVFSEPVSQRASEVDRLRAVQLHERVGERRKVGREGARDRVLEQLQNQDIEVADLGRNRADEIVASEVAIAVARERESESASQSESAREFGAYGARTAR